MDFWDQPCYTTAKIFTSILGQWPYQSKREIIFLRSFAAFCFSLQTITECLALRHYYHDLQRVMESCTLFLVHVKTLICVVNLSFNFEKERNMLEKMKENFEYFQDDDEQQILHGYADECGRMTFLYSVVLYICSMIACSEPLVMQVFQKILKFNQSFVPKFFMPMEYPGIDSDDYYYYIITMTEITVFLIATGIIASDLMLFIFTYHAIALFAALGNSVDNLPVYDGDTSKARGFKYIRKCIQKHNRAISFAKSIDDVFIWECLSTIGINMLIISLTALQVLVNTSVLGKLIKNFLYVTAQTTRLYFVCSVAQRLLDISNELQYKLICARWYHCSLKTQNLMILMIMRSQKPSAITAGKIFVMSMETFGVLMKTSVSYLTVFLAME